MSQVRLVGVSKRYREDDERPALAELDLTIPSGELAVLVGPSGCGKSTTLRIVAGLEEATTGRVYINDSDVTRVEPAHRDIAMVFQSYALYPHMSVFDNLSFGLRLRKVPASEIRERVEHVARSLDIHEYLTRKPKELSGGQRQRVAIGRAVVRNPKVFLFDEPLSNLDAKLRGEMRREVARIHKRSGATSLYVTHDQIEAMTLADRVIVLKDGLLQQVGTPIEIYEEPASQFVAGFFGTPAMNFMSAAIERSGDSLSAHGKGFQIPLPDQSVDVAEVVLGIRPEALSLREQDGATALAAAVELREMLGSEVLLHLTSDAGPLTVRAQVSEPARAGDNVTVWMPQNRLHVFDAENQRRV